MSQTVQASRSGDPQTQNSGNSGVSHLPKAYILSSGDHPSLSLAIVTLSGPKYLSLKHDIITSLLAKGKLGLIIGKLPMPSKDSPKLEA